MKRFLILFLILIISIIGFASYPDTSDTYQDLSGGGFYQWIVVRSVFPDSTLASQLGDTSQYFFKAFIDTLWVNSIRGVDLDSIGSNNSDSLGNRPASAYLINTIDTSAILYISKAYIDSLMRDTVYSKSAFKMLNKSIEFTNAAGDTVKALIQGNFVGLYDYVNNVTSVIGNHGFYKYNTAGDSGYFFLRDSSFTFWDYSTQIPVIQMTVTDTGYGEIKVSGTENHLGIYAYGLGVTDTTEDSLVFILTDEGLNFYRRADQQIYSRFGLNNLTMKDTTAGSGSYIFGVKKDSINMLTKYWTLYNNSLKLNAGIYIDSNSTFTNNITVADTGKIGYIESDTAFITKMFSAYRASIETLWVDSLDVRTAIIDTAIIDSLDVRKITADTSYAYRATGKILKIDSTATIKGGLNLGGGWTAGVDTGYYYNMSHVVKHGNVVIYDDVSLVGDASSNNQSHLGLSDTTDSNAMQLRPEGYIRHYKELTTGSRDTDSTYWGIYNYGYDLLKYATQDTTLKLRDGYVYAKDSVKTGLFKSLSGTDSTLITDGTILLTDSVIGNDSYLTGFNKVQSDTLNGKLIESTAVKNILYCNFVTTSAAGAFLSNNMLTFELPDAADKYIMWQVIVPDNAVDDDTVVIVWDNYFSTAEATDTDISWLKRWNVVLPSDTGALPETNDYVKGDFGAVHVEDRFADSLILTGIDAGSYIQLWLYRRGTDGANDTYAYSIYIPHTGCKLRYKTKTIGK